MRKTERTISVFACPTPLYNEVKTIADDEMITISAFCRMAVKNMVEDYKDTGRQSDKSIQSI
jgi:hypothetical protein|tara:strand:+ start:96 stop:281 length:186 start_codon:yes stop_codon:yes gene_type:complete